MVMVAQSSSWCQTPSTIGKTSKECFFTPFAQTTLSELSLCVYDPTGACHCQIMDWVIPGSVDMTKVKFDAQGEDDCKHNFSLVREAFSKSGITRVCTFSLVFSLLCLFMELVSKI